MTCIHINSISPYIQTKKPNEKSSAPCPQF